MRYQEIDETRANIEEILNEYCYLCNMVEKEECSECDMRHRKASYAMFHPNRYAGAEIGINSMSVYN